MNRDKTMHPIEEEAPKALSGLTVKVQMRLVFGRQLIYAVDEASKALLALTGKKTWTTQHLTLLKDFGAHIEYLPMYVELNQEDPDERD